MPRARRIAVTIDGCVARMLHRLSDRRTSRGAGLGRSASVPALEARPRRGWREVRSALPSPLANVVFPVISPIDRIRQFPWAALLIALLVLAVALVGAWCIAAWHGLTTTPPGFERLQYDSAWAFVFGGVALAAHASRLSLVGRWCGVVPILLAGLRLVAYGVPGWIDTHPLINDPWLPYGAGNYNDMGVLTALVFVPLGCALAAVDLRANRALGSVLVAMLAA